MGTKNYKNNSSKIGVYSITNIVNNKRYIGSSKSSFHSRKTKHYNKLIKGIHYNEHLQNAWNKYGENNFIFEVINICSIDDVVINEGLFIKNYKTNFREFGYNIASVSEYRFNYKMSKTHNLEKSDRKNNKNLTHNGLISNEKGLPKPFKLYDMNGDLICEYNSAKEFSEKFGGSRGHISNVLTKRKLYYNNKIILFSNDTLSKNDIRIISLKHKKKSVNLFDLNDNLINTFDTVKDCSIFLNCKDAEVRMCCLGYRKRIKNFITKYV